MSDEVDEAPEEIEGPRKLSGRLADAAKAKAKEIAAAKARQMKEAAVKAVRVGGPAAYTATKAYIMQAAEGRPVRVGKSKKASEIRPGDIVEGLGQVMSIGPSALNRGTYDVTVRNGEARMKSVKASDRFNVIEESDFR